MKVRAIWEFDADVEDADPKFVNVVGLAADLAKHELSHIIEQGLLNADEFEYSVVVE